MTQSLPKEQVVETVMRQIIRSVQGIIESARDNKFKKKCLKIVDAEDFYELQSRATAKLLSSYKRKHCYYRKAPLSNVHQETLTVIAQNRNGYSPVRKRNRKEPLKLSNENRGYKDNSQCTDMRLKVQEDKENTTSLDFNVSNTKNNSLCANTVENEKIMHKIKTEEETWKLGSQNLTTSPTFVDVSKLCDFINGVDNQIDMWLHDDSEAPVKSASVAEDEKNNLDDVSTSIDFEETMSDVTDILNTSQEFKNNLEVAKNCDSQKKCISNSSILSEITDHVLEEDSVDWLDEFENDEFWGKGKEGWENDNAFDLDALELVNVNEE